MTVTLRTITLPHGIDSGTGLLSVYFAPRLDRGGTLADYAEWIDWPSTVLQLVDHPTFEVVADGTVLNVSRDTAVPPSSDVWTTLLPKTLPVSSPDRLRPDFQSTRMPEREFAERLRTIYADLAAESAAAPPTGSEFLARPSVQALFEAGGSLGQTASEVDAFIGGRGDGPGNTDAGGETPFDWDVHQWISVLGQYPELLRLLGIVVDFFVTNPPPPAGTQRSVATTTRYPVLFPGRRQEVLPTLFDNRFWWSTCPPEPGQDAVERDGFLVMDAWGLVDIDPLQSVKAVASFSRSLVEDPEMEARVPALFENGWSLVRDDLAGRQADRLRMTAEAQQMIAAGQVGPEGLELCSDLLTTGYRVDVRVDGGPWRSLHERTTVDPATGAAGGFLIGAGGVIEHVPEDDEGWVQTTIVATELPDGGVLRDQLMRWDGWSLSVEAIGNLVDPSTGALEDNRGEGPVPGAPVQLQVDHHVPRGSLPPLQYGREYEFRVRLVDLSGVSADLDDESPAGTVLGPIRYGRWFPVGSPLVLRRTPRPDPGWGDTADTLVITSELDQDPATVATTDRLFFPPDAAWRTCELHRVPDGGHDPSSYSELVTRDALSLDDQTVPDPDTGEQLATQSDVLDPGAEQQPVDYLTDPATDGVGFVGLPAAPRALSVPYPTNGWPDRSTVRLELRAGTGRARVADGEVTVSLPPAGRTTVTVGSTIDPKHLADFGLFRELQGQGLPRRRLASLRNRILAGQHWLFAGTQQLRLVHAVRLPLQLPEVRDHEVDREPGDQDATIVLDYDLDAPSTREVTAYASWSDPVDVPGTAGPTEVTGAAVIGPSSFIPYDADDELARVSARVEFFDTKRHDVGVDAEVLARFSRYFTEELALTLRDVEELHPLGVVAASVRVEDAASPGTFYRRGPDFTVAGGNLVRVDGGAIARGTDVVVTFVPLPVARRTDEEGAEPYFLVVPSTVKPAPLLIDEVLPAIRRTELQAPVQSTVVHDGQVVRLWLERPWYDSGTGEQVGVVIDADPDGVPANTRIGRESVHRSAPVGSPVGLNFPELSRSLVGIGPGEVVPGNGPWTVLGHDVVFHEASDRWACDVRLDDAPANVVGYRPFLRLVVTRFQAESLVGRWTSPKRELEPVKLGVKREIVARRRSSAQPLLVEVTVTGAGHDGIVDVNDDTVTAFNEIEVSIQESDPDVDDPDLRWATVAGTTVVLERTVLDTVDRAVEWTTPTGEELDFGPFVGSTDEYRILVEEYEPVLRRDDDDVTTLGRVAVMTEVVPLPGQTETAL